MTASPSSGAASPKVTEPNVDALVWETRIGFSWVSQPLPDPAQRETRKQASEGALSDLAALARANTHRDQLLHDAMDALRYFGTEWEPDVPYIRPEDCDALLARFRALTGTDT